MSVPVRKVYETVLPVELEDTWSRLAVFGLFWLSTVLLAVVLLAADPVFGSFVIGVPLLLVVLARQRGLSGIPSILFGAAIAVSLVPTIFLGEYRVDFGDGVLVAGFVIFVVWVSTYPIVLRHMDREYLREHLSFPDGSVPDEPLATTRLHVVRVWMTLLLLLVVAAAFGRDLLGV